MWNPKCSGPNPRQAKKCKEDAEAAVLMSKFYQMSEQNQRIFVAMFNAIDSKPAPPQHKALG